MTTAGVAEWFRVARLVVGTRGQGVDVSNLRITFEVVKTVEAVPNTATIKVYNLENKNVARLVGSGTTGNEPVYTDVRLDAGYAGNTAQIFAGEIQFVAHYRAGTDYITEITAEDGYNDFRNAYVNVTLAAGTTDADVVDKVTGVMKHTRPPDKNASQVTGVARSRGKVLQGQAREVLSQTAHANGANWSIQDGQLQIVRADTRVGTAVVVTTATGLLEAPERNDKGVAAKCLLNPQIVINGTIKLENRAIRIKQVRQKPLKVRWEDQPADPVRLDPEGIYKVIKLTHQGDTRGNEWYTLIECISLEQPIPTSRTSTGFGAVPVGGFTP